MVEEDGWRGLANPCVRRDDERRLEVGAVGWDASQIKIVEQPEVAKNLINRNDDAYLITSSSAGVMAKLNGMPTCMETTY